MFSFGVLCHEMASAQRAWAGRSSVQIMYARSQGERLPLPQACPSLGFKVGGLRRAVDLGNGSGHWIWAVELGSSLRDKGSARLRQAMEVCNGGGQWIWTVACRLNGHSMGGCAAAKGVQGRRRAWFSPARPDPF